MLKKLILSKNSRTEKVTVNVAFSFACQLIHLIINFIARTYLIKILGEDYLGINGLFTNILTILSFAELGIGNAIIFSMYKPLAVNDISKLGSLMALYKKAYRIIGITVAAIGLGIAPFINHIIDKPPDVPENLTVIYLLFLFNTVSSYFLVYKKSIIIADQKSYIVQLITEAFCITQVILQIIILYLTHNFILYLLIQILCVISMNFISAIVADRLYPFLREKAEPLPKDESKSIFNNVKALAVYKFGTVVLAGTNNIFAAVLDGVRAVGIVSNYVMISASCDMILQSIVTAFTSSIGNHNVMSDEKKQYDIFNKTFFITAWLYGFVAVGLLVIMDKFILLWVGETLLLDKATMLAIVIGFYTNGVHYAAYVYRTTLGYFVQGQIAPIIAVVLNIILTLVLFNFIGLAGIFISTPIARMLSTGIIDPILIFKKAFHVNPLIYYVKYILFAILFIAIALLCTFCVSLITLGGWGGLILQVLSVAVIFNAVMFLIFFRTRMFKEIFASITAMIKNRGKKEA